MAKRMTWLLLDMVLAMLFIRMIYPYCTTSITL